jgi:hypothetical protein
MYPMAIIRNGKPEWQYDGHLQYMLRLSDLEGKWVTFRVDPVARPKSGKQLGWLFGCAVPMIRRRLDEHGGQWYHEFMVVNGKSVGMDFNLGMNAPKMRICNILEILCGNVGPQGEMKTVSEMTTEEFKQFMSNIQKTCNEDLDNLNIPDPDLNWRDKDGEDTESHGDNQKDE